MIIKEGKGQAKTITKKIIVHRAHHVVAQYRQVMIASYVTDHHFADGTDQARNPVH
jgi:hypothetical protein